MATGILFWNAKQETVSGIYQQGQHATFQRAADVSRVTLKHLRQTLTRFDSCGRTVMFATETQRGLTAEPPGCQQRWVRVQSTGVRRTQQKRFQCKCCRRTDPSWTCTRSGWKWRRTTVGKSVLWLSTADRTTPDSGVLRCCNTSGGGGGGGVHLGNGNGDASMLWVRLEKVSPGSRDPPRSRWCYLRCYQTLLGCMKIVKVDVFTAVECFFSALTLQDRPPM